MDLQAAMDQIEEWTTDAGKLVGGNLFITSNQDKEKKENLYHLYHDLHEYIKVSLKTPETTFLAFPAIDAYLTRLPYLYPVTLQDLISDRSKIFGRIEEIQALQKEIRSDPIYEEWDNIIDTILSFAQENHLPVTREDIDDLSEMTPILLDAMSVPTSWKQMQWAKGADAAPGKVITYWTIPSFRNLYQFTECLKLSPEQRCIAFGMIEPLVEDAADPFEAAFGRRPELITNTIHHEGESGLKGKHGGFAVLGLKRGDNIYVLEERLSWDRNPYQRDSFSYYNKRASYMPYQITFAGADKPGLVLRDNPAWDLRKYLDKEQSLWLPIMVAAVQKAFFEPEASVQMEECYVMTESVKILPAPESGELAPFTLIPRPSGMDDGRGIYSDEADELLQHLGITSDDIKNIPLELPVREYMPHSEYQRQIELRARKAIARKAEEKYWLLFDQTELNVINHGRYYHLENQGPQELMQMYRKAVLQNMDTILSALNDRSSTIYSLTKFKIDGQIQTRKHLGLQKQERVKTSVDDGRPGYWGPITSVWQFFPETLVNKRPPVAISIIPDTPEDLALLMGVPFNDMDWRFRFWRNSGLFSDRNDPVLQIDNPYRQLKFIVHLVMGKREFKTMFPNYLKEASLDY